MRIANSWLERLGLHRPELRAWALYDWANSAFVTTIIAAVFPPYFSQVACKGLAPAEATSRFAWISAIALAIAALISPILGALADFRAIRKRLLGVFLALGVAATAGFFWIREGDWLLASALFLLANLGLAGAFPFYDSLLPHIAKPGELDRVSSAGYALGYLGGGIHLGLVVVLLTSPQIFGLPGPDSPDPNADRTLATRIAFASVAVWWLLFSIPLFRRVPEPPRQLEADERASDPAWKTAFTRLRETFVELRRYRNAMLFLIAFLLYNDGIGTIIRMAAIFGTEIGLPTRHLILAILLVQFAGIPFTFLFAWLAERFGAKRMIYLSLIVYAAIALLAWRLETVFEFYLLAGLVALVQGGSQALSRSVFASLIPAHKSSEFFGFFSVMDKFAGILGPLLFGIAATITGSSRLAILSVLVFFVAGALLLSRVSLGNPSSPPTR